MKRRDFLIATLLTPLVCRAKAPRRVGIVHGTARASAPDRAARAEFLAAMRELGYREGRDCVVDFRDPARVTW